MEIQRYEDSLNGPKCYNLMNFNIYNYENGSWSNPSSTSGRTVTATASYHKLDSLLFGGVTGCITPIS